jgi:hypothetical protein
METRHIEAKAFRTFIRIYSLLKRESLSSSFKITLHKILLRSVMTHACSAWEIAADTYFLKLQLLQIRFSAPLEIFQGAHRSAICTRLSASRMYTII